MENSTIDNIVSNKIVGMLAEDDRQRYICEICSSKFAFRSSLNKHLKNKHKGNTANVSENQCYQCQYCIRKYSHKCFLYKHLKQKHHETLKPKMLVADDRQRYICEICSSKFAFRSSLNKHLKNEHKGNTANVSENQCYQCQYCIRKYSHKCSLYKHLKRKHHETLKPKMLVADDRQRYICEICSSKFAFRSSLNKHLKNKHEGNTANISKNQCYQCQYCISKYSHRSFLHKHLKQKHSHQTLEPEILVADDRRRYICEICSSKFTFRSSLSKHLKNKHKRNKANVSQKQRYQCQYCSNKYSHKSALYKHLKQKHFYQTFKPKLKSNCHICRRTFTTKGVLKKHIKNKHHLSSDKASFKINAHSCCICQFSCSKFNELVTHYLDHEINIKIENHTFENYEKFLLWKENEETTGYKRYIKKFGTKTMLNGCKRDFFICHRSGVYKSNSKGLRHLKIQGSRKIGKRCPSRIFVKTTQNGKVLVKYIISHVGHDMDLCHLNLSTTEKKTLATKIASKVPFENILDDVRNSICSEKGLRRLHLITRQDLRNIEKCFNLTASRGMRHRNDATSVDSWAKESEAILFYKPQGTSNEHVPELTNDDFVIIIMNDSQKFILEKFGKNVICLDSTHSVNQYGFELTTLLVLDELHQGFPCAFMISNKTNEFFLSVFFRYIKNEVSVIKTKTFMSDMANSFYNAWVTEMGPAEFRLFCAWHVDQAWRKNIQKNSWSQDIKKEVYKKLIVLMQETDEYTFSTMLQNFLLEIKSDQELNNFGNYFEKNYLENAKSWAYCYRKHSGLNTNMHLERMHRTLKYVYLKGKKNKRIDTCIFSLMNLIRDKVFDRMICLNKGKVTTKISNSRKRHKESLTISLDDIFCIDNENKWTIKSSRSNCFYNIIIGSNNCKCSFRCSECDICIHRYLCSCVDSSIKWNICKHVHALARFFNSNISKKSTEDTQKNDQLEIIADEKLDESNIFLKHVEQSQSDMSLVDDISVNNFQQAKQKYLQDLANLTEHIEKNINTPEELTLIKKITRPIIPTIEEVKQKNILLPSSEPANKNIIPQRLYKTRKERDVKLKPAASSMSKPTESEVETISFQLIAKSNPSLTFHD